MIVQAIIQPGIISASADISGSLQASADFTSTVYTSTAAIPYAETPNTYGTTVTIG